MNDVGKPGAGEPHARFDRGPLAKRQPRRAGTTRQPGNRRDRARPPTARRPASGLPPALESGQHLVTVTDADGSVQARLRIADGRQARELFEHPFAGSTVPNLFAHAAAA